MPAVTQPIDTDRYDGSGLRYANETEMRPRIENGQSTVTGNSRGDDAASPGRHASRCSRTSGSDEPPLPPRTMAGRSAITDGRDAISVRPSTSPSTLRASPDRNAGLSKSKN